tara:strand:+ start:254 stop:499 length:246 start_codon:yes stop_codon:yes gene_type:complete
VVKGSVTISIEDYHALIDASTKSMELKENTELAAKELQVFLSFLCTRENLEKYIEEFNRQSKTSKITITGGIAKIELNDSK